MFKVGGGSMANGHGGARPGSGPKRGPDGRVLNPYKRREQSKSSSEGSRTPTIETKAIETRRPFMSESAVHAVLEACRELQGRSHSRARSEEWNPYKIRPDRFGPVADHVRKAGRKLAMDDNSYLASANQFAMSAWQAGGLMPNDASDGMLFLGYPYLSELTQRSEFRLFGEIMSEEMTRKWIDIRGTDDESTKEKDKPKDRNKDDAEADDRRLARDEEPRSDGRNKDIERKIVELKQFLDEIQVRQTFKKIAQHDSDFGIGHLYFDLKGADVNTIDDPENKLSIGNGRDEISANKLGKGCLLGLRTIEPIWCYPTAYNAQNPLSPDWYDPLVWYVMGAEIHRTRLLPFIGRPVPDILKPAYAFGGLSMSQMAQPYVDIWLRTRESVGEIIHAFSVMILSTNMGSTTQPGGSGGANGDVLARMALANMLRDNQGIMVIDKNTEDFKNISAPISGLDELQAQAQEHLFSVGRIPAVKFAGIQPKGLNATSDGELRAFNDTVHGRQEQLFRSHLTTVLDIAQISLWGARDPDITYDFLPLYEETVKEKAEIRKIEAETDQIRVDSGIVSQEEVRSKIVADPESGYHGLDPDDVPELLQEEEQGLIPEGAGKGLEAELEEGGQPPPKPAGGAPKPGKEPPKKKSPAEDNAFNEADHPRAPDGKFGRGGSGGGSSPAPTHEHPVGSTEAFHKMAVKHKIPETAKSLAASAQALKQQHGRVSKITDHIKSLHGRLDAILGTANEPDQLTSLNDLSASTTPDEMVEFARDLSKAGNKKVDVLGFDDPEDFKAEMDALDEGDRQQVYMLKSRLETLYPKAFEAAKEVRGAAIATNKDMAALRKKIDKAPMYDEMEDEDTETLYAREMATFFDEDPENIDDLIGVSSYLADEPVSAEYAENLRGRMSDIAEEYAEQKRLEALSDEEREAEEESKVEQEKQEDEDHTNMINGRVDSAIERGWKPEFNEFGGWQRPEEFKGLASPKSIGKIYKRMQDKGIELPASAKRLLAGDSVGGLRLLAIDSALAGLTAQVAAMADVIAGLKATPAPQQQPPVINVTIDNKAKTTKTATLKRGADGNLTAVVTESNDED
jgi:phage-related protein (TIGR01555 family)